jgi:RNA polymerase sigma-70 factor (ECF subfamily)
MRTRVDTTEEQGWLLLALDSHEASLLRFAATIVGPALAADVVQDTFLKLCTTDRAAIDEHLAAWLFTVCRNRALDLRRAQQQESGSADPDLEPSPDSGPVRKLERRESMRQVASAIDALPQRYREVLLLKIDAGLSYKQIARIMNLTVGNVGFILNSALSRVRAHVEREPQCTERTLVRTK